MAKISVALIDYGMGNLHSAAKALEHACDDVKVTISADPQQILAASHVVFPGVGAIRDCMAEIRRLELDAVVAAAARQRPLLGICVGMQSLMHHSDENGGVPCLGMFAGAVHGFEKGRVDADGLPLKVPHMGWNQVQQTRPHPLWRNIADNTRFYFVHSYYVQVDDPALVTGECEYGNRFVATLGRDNVFAAQFHPEKSSHAGLTLLRNFLQWDGTL